MSGKHKNPIAAIYMMTCLDNGKIYIGETGDLLNRMSSHRNVHRRKPANIRTKIEKAIVKHGYNSFVTTILVDDKTDCKLHDNEYRRKLESEYIEKYNSSDSAIGYNSVKEYHVYATHSHHGHKLTKITKLKLSKPILVYTIDTGTVMMYTSAGSYCDINGVSDSSIISAACKFGRTIHGDIFFKMDKDKRAKAICRVIDDAYQIYHNNTFQYKTSNKIHNYIDAAREVNNWCSFYGLDTVDIDDILDQYPSKFIELIT